MFDPAILAALVKAEWSAISSAPFHFIGALFVGWLVAWLVLRAWYRRSIQIGEDQTKLVKTGLAIERRQKEGLRQALLELKPGAPVVAIEVGYGDPEIQKVVKSLARGQTISTTVNPTAPVILSPIRAKEIRNIAVTRYTTANGLSQVSTGQGGITVSTTSLGQQVANYLNSGKLSTGKSV